MVTTRRNFHIFAAMAVLATIAAGPATAQTREAPVYTGLVAGVAVGGHDPVAYFTEGKPVPGRPEISLEHEGATWRFASEANRDAFRLDPARYAPRYGGYCAWAVAQGYTAKGDPNHWSIVGGRLYLNFDRSIKQRWERDTPGFITRGDANWPRVLEKR